MAGAVQCVVSPGGGAESVACTKGLHRIEVRDSKGDPDEAVLEIKYRRIRVQPPIGKHKRYPALSLAMIHAEERGSPTHRKKIHWKLITDLPVQSRKDAIEKLQWYAMRPWASVAQVAVTVQ
jgi:hypothetical protein